MKTIQATFKELGPVYRKNSHRFDMSQVERISKRKYRVRCVECENVMFILFNYMYNVGNQPVRKISAVYVETPNGIPIDEERCPKILSML